MKARPYFRKRLMRKNARESGEIGMGGRALTWPVAVSHGLPVHTLERLVELCARFETPGGDV